MKKQWISVKCGLSRDPKHRRRMGKSIWTFLHILDLADWDSGIVYDWKDENAAEDMGIDIRVLREDRRKLAEEGYITCRQKQHGQDIIISNWTNPREYSGEVKNKKVSPSEIQGNAQDDAQGSVKDVTPTYDSNIKESKTADADLSQDEIQQVNAKVDYIISNNQPENAWAGRELIRADLLPYADWYHKVTGQVMTKRVQSAWWKALGEWKAEGLAISDLQEAYDARSKWRKVATPVELTADAVAIHALPAQNSVKSLEDLGWK